MPSDVVKVTWVPVCGGVPEGSITCATIGAMPLIGRTVVGLVSVRVDPDGASRDAIAGHNGNHGERNRTSDANECVIS